jgi:hypothetical protein
MAAVRHSQNLGLVAAYSIPGFNQAVIPKKPNMFDDFHLGMLEHGLGSPKLSDRRLFDF